MNDSGKQLPESLHEAGEKSVAAASHVRGWLSSVGREPLVHFVALGFILWMASDYASSVNNRYTIVMGPAERQLIESNYARRFGQAPTPDQLRQLIDRYVRDEIAFREGLAQNLEQDDEVIRERIVQKYNSLQADLAVPQKPAPDVLEHWFQQNTDKYTTPEQVTLSHIYFSADEGYDAEAKVRATKILQQLNQSKTTRGPSMGDSFPGPLDISALAPDGAALLFGKSELSQQLFKVPVNTWAGPFRSEYGWHLVYVTEHTPPKLPPFSEIRDRVLPGYLDDQRRILNEQAYEKLRAKFTVRDEKGGQ